MFGERYSLPCMNGTNKGRPSVILGCSTNIQERKNQELSLEEAKVKAEAADKMKSKYLADMSP